MWKKLALVMALVVGGVFMFSGCAMMFAHIEQPNEYVQQIATYTAVADHCVACGYLKHCDVEEFKYYSSALLAISVYDKDVYEKAYKEAEYEILMDEEESVRRGCNDFKSKFASATTHVKNKYFRDAQWLANARAAEFQAISKSLNQSTPTIYKPQNITVPSVSFGNNERKQSYESSFGNKYQYDLSNPSDRVKYSVDPAAQLRDRIDVNPIRGIESNIGEHGGGVYGR